MQRIRIELEADGYDIVVGRGMIARLTHLLSSLVEPSRVLIVSHPGVDRLYGTALREVLGALSCEVLTELIPEGEEWKTLETVEKLLHRMAEAGLDRKSLLVALGGGVVGDMGGFAAAIFMRGISYIQIPTTLLAQVDSSIGGKVGVDHPLAKNLIGAFYQPLLVCTDPTVLASLPEAQLRTGMAEIVKYGMIADESLFALLERHADSLLNIEPGLLEDVIKRCCQTKARIVQQDIRETTGLRTILNYGHTIGHAIESVTGYTRFTHGEAISIGMVGAARIARLMDLMSEEAETRQKNLLSKLGLPVGLAGIQPHAVIEATRLDKKAAGGKTRFVVPLTVGRVVVRENIPRAIVKRALEEIGDS